MADPNIEAFTLLALGLAMIGLRVGVRWSLVGPSSFHLDDYLMPLAGVIFILETVAAYLVGSEFGGLTNSYMTREQRAALNPDSKEYSDRVTNSKLQVIGWSFYAAILWLTKASLAVFYSRLTTGLMYLPIRIRVAYVFIGVTYISTALSIILGCQPISKNWQINPDPGNLCQPAVSKLNVLVVAIPNVLTDFYLLAIPLPLLWKVNVSVRRRITLMALFSGAIFVITATIIRAVVIIKAGPEGAISGSKWACRETFVAIIVSNLPIIQPLIRKAASKIGLSAIFHSYPRASRSHHFSSKGQRSGGYELRNRDPHPLSISQATAWGSNEHILGEEDSNDHTAQDKPLKEITVVQETVVKSEPWPAGQSGPSEPPIEAWAHNAAR